VFHEQTVERIIHRLVSWKESKPGRDVHIVGGCGRGASGCASSELVLRRAGHFPSVISQLVVGPITANPNCRASATAGTFGGVSFSHRQPRVERNYGLVTVALVDDSEGTLCVSEGCVGPGFVCLA
jgi:hypothetical protein